MSMRSDPLNGNVAPAQASCTLSGGSFKRFAADHSVSPGSGTSTLMAQGSASSSRPSPMRQT